MKENNMAINFNDEETIICFNGVQIHISKKNSMELAHRILDYFEWYEEEEDRIVENSIEEDIKIIEDFILKTDVDYSEYNEQIVGDISYQAIQHLLSDYKKVVKEANRYKNMYEAEHEIHLVRNEQLERKENAIIKCKELENENKTIKEANDYWRSRYCEILNNSIPIQKIKDKIEELKKDETSKYYYMFLEDRDLENTIQVLQELLESEEK